MDINVLLFRHPSGLLVEDEISEEFVFKEYRFLGITKYGTLSISRFSVAEYIVPMSFYLSHPRMLEAR